MFVTWFVKCLGRFPTGGVRGYWHWFFATAGLALAAVYARPMIWLGYLGWRFIAGPAALAALAVFLYVLGYLRFVASTASVSQAVAQLSPHQRRMLDALSAPPAEKIRGLHRHPDIPPDKLRNALVACELAPGTEVLALLDLTLFGSAKEALLVCADELHYRWPSAAGPKRIAFEDFRNLAVSATSGIVHIGPEFVFASGQPAEVAALLAQLQPALAEPAPASAEEAAQADAAARTKGRKGALGGFATIVIGALIYFYYRDSSAGRENPVLLWVALVVSVGVVLAISRRR